MERLLQIHSARFVASSPSLKSCPVTDLPEFAFIGRSNVGKSSLINMLTGTKGLAKVSSTPGKTRLINHFIVDDAWFIVDLPGYGFAKVSKEESRKLQAMIESYMLRRDNLKLTFLLIDSRHSPQSIDLEFMQWMTRNRKPFVILFTKTDKLKKTEVASHPASYRKILRAALGIDPSFIITSSEKRIGKEEILEQISRL